MPFYCCVLAICYETYLPDDPSSVTGGRRTPLSRRAPGSPRTSERRDGDAQSIVCRLAFAKIGPHVGTPPVFIHHKQIRLPHPRPKGPTKLRRANLPILSVYPLTRTDHSVDIALTRHEITRDRPRSAEAGLRLAAAQATSSPPRCPRALTWRGDGSCRSSAPRRPACPPGQGEAEGEGEGAGEGEGEGEGAGEGEGEGEA